MDTLPFFYLEEKAMAESPKSVVTTGFGNIHVALYQADNGVVTYTGMRKLGRSVSMTTDISTSDDNNFYADDRLAETETGSAFTDGSGTMTVDGLTADDEAFLMGLKAGNTVDVGGSGNNVETYAYGADMDPPYIGIGAVKKVQRDGKSYWKAFIMTKCRCKVLGDDATTQGDQIDWQTQDIDFTILRDDSAKNNWKIIPKKLFETENEAIAFIKKALGGE